MINDIFAFSLECLNVKRVCVCHAMYRTRTLYNLSLPVTLIDWMKLRNVKSRHKHTFLAEKATHLPFPTEARSTFMKSTKCLTRLTSSQHTDWQTTYALSHRPNSSKVIVTKQKYMALWKIYGTCCSAIDTDTF